MNRRLIQMVFQFILFSYLKNFTVIILYNMCAVPWRDIMMHLGRYLEYGGECSVPWGDIMIHVGDIMSTVGVFSTVGGIIVPQLSKCRKFEAIRGDQTDQRICI